MKLSIGTLIKYKSAGRQENEVAIGVITRLNEEDGTCTVHWTDDPDSWPSSISRLSAGGPYGTYNPAYGGAGEGGRR